MHFAQTNKLDKRMLDLCVVFGCYTIVTCIEKIFLNILLVKIAQNNSISMQYNIFSFTICALTMLFASILVNKKGAPYVFRLGICSLVVLNALMLAFFNDIIVVKDILAVFSGAGSGCVLCSYTILLCNYSHNHNRDRAVAFMGVVAGVLSLLTPMLAGAIINKFALTLSNTGYEIVFALCFAISLFAFLFCSKLKNCDFKSSESQYRQFFKILFNDKTYLICLFTVFIKCIREGVLQFLFSLILFEMLKSETAITINAVLVGIAGIVGAGLYGKIVKPDKRVYALTASVLLLSTISILSLILKNTYIVLAYSVINAVLSPVLYNPSFSIVSNYVLSREASKNMMTEYVAVREVFVALGRISGICFTLFLSSTLNGYLSAILIITVLQFLTCPLCTVIEKRTRQTMY